MSLPKLLTLTCTGPRKPAFVKRILLKKQSLTTGVVPYNTLCGWPQMFSLKEEWRNTGSTDSRLGFASIKTTWVAEFTAAKICNDSAGSALLFRLFTKSPIHFGLAPLDLCPVIARGGSRVGLAEVFLKYVQRNVALRCARGVRMTQPVC